MNIKIHTCCSLQVSIHSFVPHFRSLISFHRRWRRKRWRWRRRRINVHVHLKCWRDKISKITKQVCTNTLFTNINDNTSYSLVKTNCQNVVCVCPRNVLSQVECWAFAHNFLRFFLYILTYAQFTFKYHTHSYRLAFSKHALRFFSFFFFGFLFSFYICIRIWWNGDRMLPKPMLFNSIFHRNSIINGLNVNLVSYM